MLIQLHAFYNCLSLKVVDFSKCNTVCSTALYQDNVDLSQISVIVKDKLYEQQKKVESPFVNIVKKSDILLEKMNKFENANIMKSICMLEYAKIHLIEKNLQNAIDTIAQYLKQKYIINDNKLKTFKDIFYKYNKLKENK